MSFPPPPFGTVWELVFELPHVIAESKGKLPDRIELEAGDFFKDKLPSCDAYLLKAILHDWCDNSARTIPPRDSHGIAGERDDPHPQDDHAG
jgi:O-methyltransferase domain